jgi:hypothetical protein
MGGHGPMWDLVDNPDSIALIESFYNSGKPVAAVRHSPAVLHRVTYNGAPIVRGKRPLVVIPYSPRLSWSHRNHEPYDGPEDGACNQGDRR